MALYQEGGRGRPLDRFAEIAGKVTRRPSSHTDRADALGFEKRRHPLRGRAHRPDYGYRGSDELLVRDSRITHEEPRVVRIKLPQPRPEVPEPLQIAEQLEAVEETIVVDFSSGPDEVVRRPDVFELSYAPPAAPEEAGVFVVKEAEEMPVFAKPVRKRDGKTYRFVDVARAEAKAFVREVGAVGAELRGNVSPKRFARIWGQAESAARLSGRSHHQPSRAGV